MILRKRETWGFRAGRKGAWCQGERNFIALFDSTYGAPKQT